MADQKKVVRRKSAAARAVDPWEGLTDPGDHIEFSITAEVKNRQGRSFWAKGGVRTTQRDGESTRQAKDRAAEFVTAYVEEQISDYLS